MELSTPTLVKDVSTQYDLSALERNRESTPARVQPSPAVRPFTASTGSQFTQSAPPSYSSNPFGTGATTRGEKTPLIATPSR